MTYAAVPAWRSSLSVTPWMWTEIEPARPTRKSCRISW